MARILVIEDDPATACEIVAELRDQGHEVDYEADGRTALSRAVEERFDVLTLDRMLPGLDGLSLVSQLREQGVSTPVLMISALSDLDERIAGLRAGGNDYMVKPFALAEVVMRVEVLLRPWEAATKAVLRAGPVTMDLIRRQVFIDGTPVRLLQMEFRLLEFLVRHVGETMNREVLFQEVWGYTFDPGANVIAVHIGRLRKKIDKPGRPSLISTIKGGGYRFDAD